MRHLYIFIVAVAIFSYYGELSKSQNKHEDIASMFRSEVEHLRKHLGSDINEKNVNDKKLTMLNFRIHDTDKNGVLDGLELRRMIAHNHEDHHKEKLSDEAIRLVIDNVLKVTDMDLDRLITFNEFIKLAEL